MDTSVGASLSELLRQQTWRPIINRRSLATSSVCAPPPSPLSIFPCDPTYISLLGLSLHMGSG